MVDLPQLVAIERRCFTAQEAATEEALEKRIKTIPDSFLVAEEEEAIVGYINGPVIETAYITDDLFEESAPNPSVGGHQSVLGLAVSPHAQHRGVATALLTTLEQEAKKQNRETMTLTCKAVLIQFYKKLGYTNTGVADSTHGGATWYNLIKRL
ncbi:GNAT family N-acetyltransferase [Caldalkalibacillus salinus]|uniref:GNAT family N-acetyltransferase n=1 Tax=Caldalkalibacillus salinus TaxID=2803787 RepID=UPI0019206330|nr:GNAT family N-acetyltransferase [Caldalkalibacillus salinus]